VPAAQLVQGKTSIDNFTGKKAPVRLAFPTLQGLLRMQ
jgi:hypothetical protein